MEVNALKGRAVNARNRLTDLTDEKKLQMRFSEASKSTYNLVLIYCP